MNDKPEKTVNFFVPGLPRGKGSVKARNAGKFVQTYTDKQTRSAIQHVTACFCEAVPADWIPWPDGYVSVNLRARYPLPKGAGKWKIALLNGGYHIKRGTKPDVDNIIKLVLDGLNKVAFRDDAMVTQLTADKRYTLGVPGVQVTLRFYKPLTLTDDIKALVKRLKARKE